VNRIAGVHHGGQRPAEPAQIHAMLAVFADRRGERGVRVAGSTAIGSLDGAAYDGPLMAVADARLDNRAELASLLGLEDAVSDTQLILAAYRRWGEELPARLLGDFAFAIHDADRRRLFCARDCFGVRPFYYARQGEATRFASEPKALIAGLPELRRISEASIANFLVGQPPDGAATFYEGIDALPAAHWLIVEPGRVELRRYWRIEPTEPLQGKDLAEQFRSIFTEAVRCRLDGGGAAGAMLSGGLDSSSIACTAAPIHIAETGKPLPTFSLVFDRTPEWNERPYIEAAVARGGMDPRFIESGDHAPFEDFERILVEQDGPLLAPILPISREVHRRAAREGVKVLLDGHGGDEVVSHGQGRLNELARGGRWLALWREVRAAADTYHGSPAATFAQYARYHRPMPRIEALIRRARTLRGGPSEDSGIPAWRRFVNPDLVSGTDLPARMREAASRRADPLAAEKEQHLAILDDPLQSYAFTVLDRNAAAARIEPRYPFWDRRLVQFCLSLPPEQKLDGGWSRLILRRAMEGVLPPVIQWRRDKLDFAPHLATGMVDRHHELIEAVLNGGGAEIAPYVNLVQVRAAFERLIRLRDRSDGADIQAVWRAVSLALWLRTLRV
jgi:asparagine synthase (glutamine-hydrolysing)